MQPGFAACRPAYMREAIAQRVRTDLERSTPTLWERIRDLIEATPDEYGRLILETYEQAKRQSPRGSVS